MKEQCKAGDKIRHRHTKEEDEVVCQKGCVVTTKNGNYYHSSHIEKVES